MKFYFIVPDEKNIPHNHLLSKLEPLGEVVTIIHRGKLSDISELKEDNDEKVLGVFPVSFAWDLDVESLKDIPNVIAVCASSTSFDWIKPDQLRDLGISGHNVPGFASESVAEYVMCMATEVARYTPLMIKNGWKYNFDRDVGMLLRGKTAGVVGLGRIGKRIAEACHGAGMDVRYWSKNSRDDRFQYMELDDLFKSSTLIVPALVENGETKDIITRARIDLMSDRSILVGINRVRTLWDEDYVLDRVRNQKIMGYALEGDDVKELSEYEGNVWALPSMIWYTQDSIDNFMEIWVDNMISIAQDNPENKIT